MAREGRKYDIAVFGASGFTGKKIVEEIITSGFKGTFVLAGRNRQRLELLAAELGIPNAPLAIADVKDPQSLLSLTQQSKVLINAVGPFRYYGQPVVEACIAASCNYLDISGEPEFIERIELEFHQKAQQAGCYVASAVGFDSVPGDVGAYWTASQFKPPAHCTSVETFITLKGGPSGFRAHYATYESAVMGFAAAGELSKLRKAAAANKPKVAIPGPRLKINGGVHYDERVGTYVIPFMGSDASVVKRTVALLAAEKKNDALLYHIGVYLTLPSRWAVWLFSIYGTLFKFLAQRPWGRTLLLNYPGLFSYGIFSHKGPNEQQMKESSFEMINIAKGYSSLPSPSSTTQQQKQPNVEMKTRVAGPEPGYIACSVFIVAAARVLLEEREKMDVPFGVHTPAYLLHNTTYVDRLKRRGIVFEVLNE